MNTLVGLKERNRKQKTLARKRENLTEQKPQMLALTDWEGNHDSHCISAISDCEEKFRQGPEIRLASQMHIIPLCRLCTHYYLYVIIAIIISCLCFFSLFGEWVVLTQSVKIYASLH